MNNVISVLSHNNIINKYGNISETAVTNIDVHDIARTTRTYGLKEYAIITRLKSQKVLLDDILRFWVEEKGGEINPDRKEALSRVRHYSIFRDLTEKYPNHKIIITDASRHEKSTSYKDMSKIIKDNPDNMYLLVFGTGWGLDPLMIDKADYILPPIGTPEDYNHLSVRAAAAIIIDRLAQKSRS
ncbi:MAG: hypothetical protein C0601_04390 [Candidatus Muiribacterium halophilum]|uniref:tRNA (guanine-N(1)-)-methyltransferase C-terminal domain-containing protein n=1 Tax=Muiribacterium halophilum TaxID=2053465 RepID=A0A2N5ZIU1_MUIH1|nr:MAG: hypothetical protein C0601_04390 [Candidatus Muirbacterium halophilum]